MTYLKHFAERASDYQQFRPCYPQVLFDYLLTLVTERDYAWDCGTGNGQAAYSLADYFKQVIATDISPEQLREAPKKTNLNYLQTQAEKTQIATHSIDLITIAQALHWFNLPDFYEEVRRVSKPNGLIAAWCYSLGKINPEIDVLLEKLYSTILGKEYWPKERYYIDEKYKTIPFPFHRLPTPTFYMEKAMDYDQLVGYLHTWSAVKDYQQRLNQDPTELIMPDLLRVWRNEKTINKMRWPIHLMVGRVHSSIRESV